MNIVVSGYYGSKNGGDEAMLASMLEVLREEIPDLSATVISINPEYTKKRHHVEAVERREIRTIIKKIRAADLLISGGLDKREMAKGKEAIDRMVDAILPVMKKRGGYIPTCDHGVPEEVKLDDYLYLRKRLHEFG